MGDPKRASNAAVGSQDATEPKRLSSTRAAEDHASPFARPTENRAKHAAPMPQASAAFSLEDTADRDQPSRVVTKIRRLLAPIVALSVVGAVGAGAVMHTASQSADSSIDAVPSNRVVDEVSRSKADRPTIPSATASTPSTTPSAAESPSASASKSAESAKAGLVGSETSSASPSASSSARSETSASEKSSSPAASALGSVTGTRYTTSGIYVRSAPSSTSEPLSSLAKGDSVSITDVSDGSWQQVKFNGKPGWVSSDYLTSAKPASPKPSPSKSATSKPSSGLGTVVGTRYTTAGINVRSAASSSAKSVGSLPTGASVSITNVTDGSWQQIKFSGKAAWVSSKYLTSTKPTTGGGSSGGLSGAPCASGSSVERGLTPNAIKVHRAVCARFPNIRNYHGIRNSADYHGSGRAIDIMVSGAAGTQVRDFVRANYSSLGVTEIIYAQRIWTTQRSSEGWRFMSDRGSVTANHYDHVHVTVR